MCGSIDANLVSSGSASSTWPLERIECISPELQKTLGFQGATPGVLLRVSERQNAALNRKICHFYATREKGEEKKHDPVAVKCIAVASRIPTRFYLLIFKTIWAADARPQSLAAIG